MIGRYVYYLCLGVCWVCCLCWALFTVDCFDLGLILLVRLFVIVLVACGLLHLVCLGLLVMLFGFALVGRFTCFDGLVDCDGSVCDVDCFVLIVLFC